MDLAPTMARLEALGSAQARKTYARHGVTGPSFGVRYADLHALRKEIGVDHALALALYATGNHDARVLATMVADAQAMTVEQLDAWEDACDDYVLNDAVSSLAGRSAVASTIAARWRKAEGEYRSAAGWHVVASLAGPGSEVDDAWLRPCLQEIRAGIGAAPNRTRSAMNNALIAIGGYREGLRAEALAVAAAIGTVEVDHGDTDCKTPDAATYIAKMAARQAGKKGAKKGSAVKKGSAAKKASAKKTSAKKTSAKKTSAKKTSAKKTSAKKTSAAKAR